jgi:RNA polymerase sigma-70 factor (ECF subfamily)
VAHHSSSDADADLVRRCLADDAEAWRELVDGHRGALIDLAARLLPRTQAADVVDAVISDLWQRRKLSQYEGRSSLRTWLGAVVVNASLNARRAANARADAGSAAAAEEPAAMDPPIVDNQELAAVLHDAIAALSPGMKAIVLLYYEQQLSLDAISRLVGSSKSTLSRTLRRARETIVETADRLARHRGATLETLRRGADLSQLELDLRAACSTKRHRPPRLVSNR